MKKSDFVLPLKSVAVGASMLVPGVSGGTMAILLGIYDDIIHAVSTLTQNPKKNLLLLGKFLLGSLLGIGLFARLVGYLVETYPFPMLYFFLGAVAGGLPTLYKKAQIEKFNPLYLLYIVGGFVIVWLISLLPKDLVNLGTAINWTTAIWLVIAGGHRRCRTGTAGHQRFLYATHAGPLSGND